MGRKIWAVMGGMVGVSLPGVVSLIQFFITIFFIFWQNLRIPIYKIKACLYKCLIHSWFVTNFSWKLSRLMWIAIKFHVPKSIVVKQILRIKGLYLYNLVSFLDW